MFPLLRTEGILMQADVAAGKPAPPQVPGHPVQVRRVESHTVQNEEQIIQKNGELNKSIIVAPNDGRLKKQTNKHSNRAQNVANGNFPQAHVCAQSTALRSILVP